MLEFIGSEIYGPADVRLATSISLPEIPLLPGYHYYTTVSAFNAVNMTAFAISRGFVVDVEPPSEGVAFVGHNFHDKSYQSGSFVEVSWQGFVDKHSHIMEYLYCITESGQEVNETEFISTNLANQLTINGEFYHGQSYQLHVLAIDAALHESDVVSSHPVLIDNTPPLVKLCEASAAVEKETLTCQCNPIVEGHSQKSCKCVVMFNSTFQPGEMYQVTVTLDNDPSDVNAKMEVNGLAGWMTFSRQNVTSFWHSSSYVSSGEQVITSVIHTDRVLTGSAMVYLSKCSTLRSDFTEDLHVIKQVNELKLLIHIPIYDQESGIESVEVGVATTKDGSQLLPYTYVGHEKSVLLDLELQHGMEVSAVILATNRANLKTVVRSEKYVIDWTPPIIVDIDVKTSVQDGDLSLSVSWKHIEMESVVTDCLWAIGQWILIFTG